MTTQKAQKRPQVVRPCVFCGGDGPKATEDVVPRWFKRQLFPDLSDGLRSYRRRAEFHSGTVHEPAPEEVFRRDRSIVGIKAYGVCKYRCNGGWMSRLQNRAIPPLTLLIESARSGSSVVLPSDDAAAVAKWMTMTALTANLADHKSGQAHELAAVRRSAVDLDIKPPLPLTHCWAARSRRSYDAPSMVNARLDITAYSDGSTVRSYFLSVVLDRLVLLGHLRDVPSSVAEPTMNLNHWAPIAPTPPRGATYPPLLTSGDRTLSSPFVEAPWIDQPYRVKWPDEAA